MSRNQNILVSAGVRQKWKMGSYHGIITDMVEEGIGHKNQISIALRTGFAPMEVADKITEFIDKRSKK